MDRKWTPISAVEEPADKVPQNLPFISVGSILVILFLKLNFLPASLASKLRRVDWVGTVVFVGSTTSVLIPLTWGPLKP